jgi:hypothetical protein
MNRTLRIPFVFDSRNNVVELPQRSFGAQEILVVGDVLLDR